jgi:hypothetical protein
MYDSSMKTGTYPLAVPTDLLSELRETARETGLSVADTMRQSMKLGLPKLREQLSSRSLKPLTSAECRECWQTPDPEFDRLAAHCAGLPVSEPEE